MPYGYEQPSFSSRIIAAFQAGSTERQADQDRLQEQEDRKLRQEILQDQLRQLKLQDKIRAHDEARQRAADTQGTPGMARSATIQSQAPIDNTLVPSKVVDEPIPAEPTPGQSRTLDLGQIAHAPINIPGVYGPDYSVRPQTQQEVAGEAFKQAMLKMQMEAEQKKRENMITVPGSLLGGETDEPVTVDNRVVPVLSGNARQEDQQTFTDEQNRLNREAADRRAREGQAAIDRRTREARDEALVKTEDEQGNPILAKRGDLGAGPIKGQRGAEERIKAEARGKGKLTIGQIDKLSVEINQLEGLTAKMVGGARKVAAKANLDALANTYESLTVGAVPLVARMLGHVGILTQQDVDSVRAMFPKLGDSKLIRDAKMANVRGIVMGDEAELNRALELLGADPGNFWGQQKTTASPAQKDTLGLFK
ncbi:MAG: hypothetical protein EHM23_33835 [Acidobacteria bacterium]|nr:MAG: hypothetical protein EHM23_33835 [Acidobacteriota bacterium]